MTFFTCWWSLYLLFLSNTSIHCADLVYLFNIKLVLKVPFSAAIYVKCTLVLYIAFFRTVGELLVLSYIPLHLKDFFNVRFSEITSQTHFDLQVLSYKSVPKEWTWFLCFVPSQFFFFFLFFIFPILLRIKLLWYLVIADWDLKPSWLFSSSRSKDRYRFLSVDTEQAFARY